MRGPNTYLSISVYVPDGKSSYDTGLIWIRTRRAVTAQDLNETQADQDIRERFLHAMGKKFDVKELTFFTKPFEGK